MPRCTRARLVATRAASTTSSRRPSSSAVATSVVAPSPSAVTGDAALSPLAAAPGDAALSPSGPGDAALSSSGDAGGSGGGLPFMEGYGAESGRPQPAPGVFAPSK